MSGGELIITLAVIALFAFLVTRKGTTEMQDNEETVETTTTEEPHYNIVGNLPRRHEGIQSFVIDPSDQQKIWINSNDDMYEDAEGRIWRLV